MFMLWQLFLTTVACWWVFWRVPCVVCRQARVCVIEVAMAAEERDGGSGALVSQKLWFHKPVQCDFITRQHQLQVWRGCPCCIWRERVEAERGASVVRLEIGAWDRRCR